jgi:ABC-2 type transport system ATP-binding protein
MTTDFAIATYQLSKSFGQKVAVQDLSLRVERGEVFGFLGPNGAGKTTSVKMLLGLMAPSSGSGEVLGALLGDSCVRERIGFLPEHFRFHDWLTASEFLTLHADLYGMPRSRTLQRVPELLERVGLSLHADKKLRAFSKGMLQRVGLAQTLLNEPDLVILDEPTSGLDPMGRRLVRDILHELRARGVTVLLNSHFLSEVEITCDRVAFIKQGQIVHTSRLNALIDGELTVEIRAAGLTSETVAGLARWGQNLRRDGEIVTMTVSDEEMLPAINRYLVEASARVYALRPTHLSLEQLFLQIVGREDDL